MKFNLPSQGRNSDHAREFLRNSRDWQYRPSCGCKACVSMEVAKTTLIRLDASYKNWQEDTDMVIFLRHLCVLMKQRHLVPAGVDNVMVTVVLPMPSDDGFN